MLNKIKSLWPAKRHHKIIFIVVGLIILGGIGQAFGLVDDSKEPPSPSIERITQSDILITSTSVLSCNALNGKVSVRMYFKSTASETKKLSGYFRLNANGSRIKSNMITSQELESNKVYHWDFNNVNLGSNWCDANFTTSIDVY